jgi:hypothetical protein
MVEFAEVSDVLQLLDASQDDAYTKLMQREKRVLDAANKITKHYDDTRANNRDFLHMSLHDIALRTADVAAHILRELARVQTPADALRACTRDDRLIYIGVLLALLSVVAFVCSA